MRWIFFSLLILNVVYLIFSLVLRAAPSERPQLSAAASIAPASLVLLSEAPVAPASVTPPVSTPPLCPAIGPWAVRAEAEQALQQLRRSRYQVTLESLQVERDRLHWVYLPAGEDRTQALRLLRELQGKGVDSFIVAEGADANAISLGYFSSADSARGLMVKMQSAGYPAVIRETSRETTEYWLRVAADSIKDEGEALRAMLGASPELSGNHVSCDSTAEKATESEKLSSEG